LRLSKTSFVKLFKPLTGGLLVAFVVLLNAMAALPALHELFHADADRADHQCAVTLFAHGQMDAADVAVAVIVPPVVADFFSIPATLVFSSAVETLPPGRAPPSVVSPLV
jgi:hypothetical protein